MRALALPAAAALAFSALFPSAADAAAAAVSVTSVNLRAGPSSRYPVVVRLPSRAPLTLYGCNAATTWCDVSWDGERGWVAATYVSVSYRGSYTVMSPAVAPAVGLAVAGFSYAYWNAHYVDRPWYGHWRHHHHGHHGSHNPDRVKAVGGCKNGVCGGAVAGPRRVAVGHCGKRHCSGTVIKRPRPEFRAGREFRRAPGVRIGHAGLRRR